MRGTALITALAIAPVCAGPLQVYPTVSNINDVTIVLETRDEICRRDAPSNTNSWSLVHSFDRNTCTIKTCDYNQIIYRCSVLGGSYTDIYGPVHEQCTEKWGGGGMRVSAVKDRT